jgi:hypothetical protein
MTGFQKENELPQLFLVVNSGQSFWSYKVFAKLGIMSLLRVFSSILEQYFCPVGS